MSFHSTLLSRILTPLVPAGLVLLSMVHSACGQTPADPPAKPAKGGQGTLATQDPAVGQDEATPPPPFVIQVADGALEFTVDGAWKKVTPKSNMIESEIKIVRLAEDKEDGRLTIMGAGGSIEANIQRWEGQFSDQEEDAKVETKVIADQQVHFVDIAGTFMDAPAGPFAGGKTIERADYRMLAAIIETKDKGNYFVKFYGPADLMKDNEQRFKSMIESLAVK